jgi:uncharacterized protein (DUF488 family)
VDRKVTVFTVGTSGRDAEELARVLIRNQIDHIIDCRAKPRSRKPCWNHKRLVERFGGTYIWARYFGNPLRLPLNEWAASACGSEASGIIEDMIKAIRRGVLGNVILLCQERDPSKCHRSAVARLIDLETVHL